MGADLVHPSRLRFQFEYSMLTLARQDTPVRNSFLTAFAPRLGVQHARPSALLNFHKRLVEDARIALGQTPTDEGEIGLFGAAGCELI